MKNEQKILQRLKLKKYKFTRIKNKKKITKLKTYLNEL